jgi:nitrite reductase/ring-hydroxylating ferredoxin subunit
MSAPASTASWVAVLKTTDLPPGDSRILDIGGKSIGLFHENGRYYAVLNFCPHAGAPICRGWVEGQVVCDDQGKQTYDHQTRVLRCPWHHWGFDLATGKAATPIPQRLKIYPVRVEGEDILVQI